jgi:osmotically-inducible protein OsmY
MRLFLRITHTAVVLVVLGVATTAFARVAQNASSTMTRPTDDALQDRIEFRLETTDSIAKYDIDVDVKDGVAMLSGEVATAKQKAEATQLASIEGVRRVESAVTVSPDADKTWMERTKKGLDKAGNKIDDAWITTKVKWFLMREPLLDGSDVNVDTMHNVVTLKGTVTSDSGKARATALARRTDGVTRVDNQLTIAPKRHD